MRCWPRCARRWLDLSLRRLEAVEPDPLWWLQRSLVPPAPFSQISYSLRRRPQAPLGWCGSKCWYFAVRSFHSLDHRLPDVANHNQRSKLA
jgi:hypothetical protein